MTREFDEFDRLIRRAISGRPEPVAPCDLADRAMALHAAGVRQADLKMARMLRLRRRNHWVSIAASVLIGAIVLAGVWHIAGHGDNSLLAWTSSSSAPTASTTDSTSATSDNSLIQPSVLLAAIGLIAAVVLLSAAGSMMEQTGAGASELVLN
jgi:hypothetical protein